MKYEISDIKRVVNRLISYFRTQEDVSSQKEMSELWNRIECSINARHRRHQMYAWSTIVVAASLLGCIWLGVSFFSSKGTDLSGVAAGMLDKAVETDEIQLIIAPEKTLQVKDGGTVTYSQDGRIHVNEDKVTTDEVSDNPYDQIIVPKGRFGRLILADGSELYINSGTKVVYPKRFDKNRREIFVDGEIYIDVQHSEKAPFVVKTAQFNVEVLGTAFNVKAYSNQHVKCGEIVLLRGLVNVKSRTGGEVKLKPNNKAIVPSEGMIQTVAVEADDYILWTKGILPLNNGTVGDIVDDLSRYYDVEITCDENIKEIRIAGKIDLQRGVDKAMRNLSLTGGFTWSKQADTYVLQLQKNDEP